MRVEVADDCRNGLLHKVLHVDGVDIFTLDQVEHGIDLAVFVECEFFC